jgi:hypothetical protein
MKFLRRLFAPRPKAPAPDPAFENADRLLDEFVIATLAPLDRAALGRDAHRLRLAQAFHLGACSELARREGLDETRRLALGVRYLSRHAGTPSAGGSITALEEAIGGDTELRAHAREGETAMGLWHTSRDARATRRLRELLDYR